MVRVCVVEDGLLERLHFAVHLVRRDVWLELREVVDGALAVRRGDDVGGVLADILGDLAPCSLDGGDGISQRAILHTDGMSTGCTGRGERVTHHVEENGVGVKC